MNQELNPALAFDTATTLRAAAGRRLFPAWFPPAVGIGYAISLPLMGVSLLMRGGGARVLGLTGAALVVLTFGTMLPVVVGWRRDGVVPKFEGCEVEPDQRRRQLWTAALSAVGGAAAMVAVVLAQWGWIEIVLGPVIGALTWRRLARRGAR